MKILIGGSPCTRWSIAQTKNRETEASGIGWELFLNYRIARDKYQTARGSTGSVSVSRTVHTAKFLWSSRRTGVFCCGIFWRQASAGARKAMH